MTQEILFCGDPHREFRCIVQETLKRKPGAIILLGDLELQMPLSVELKEILQVTKIYLIPGNHDTDSESNFKNLFEDPIFEEANLHGRVVEVVPGVKVAGLGGVFRGHIWHPEEGPWKFETYEDFVAKEKHSKYFSETKRKHRSSIFPSDYFALADRRADILVTHEAGSFHPYGFKEIDQLAVSCGVGRHFHGHLHDSLVYERQDTFQSTGVGFRSITSLRDDVVSVIRPGDFDERHGARYEAEKEKPTTGRRYVKMD